VGRAATVDDLNAGWELAHEIMHLGFLRESPAMKTLSNYAGYLTQTPVDAEFLPQSWCSSRVSPAVAS